MSPQPASVDVVVVGAGLSGLRAAGVLQSAGLDAVVIERGDAVGGRVRTDAVDGLLLDRGFQLYNPAYPEGARALDHAALDLRPFTPGVVVAAGAAHHRVADVRRRPGWAWSSLRAPLGSPRERARLGAYALGCARASMDELRARPDVSATLALRAAGVGPAAVELLLRPFLSGVFLESDLSTSRRFLDLVLRSFARGRPSVPAAGMQAVPDQLAQRLAPGSLRLGVEVSSITGRGVRTAEGEVSARAVVVATDGRGAAQLLTGIQRPATHAVTTWYHLADCSGGELHGGEPVLVVDGDRRGPLVNAVVVSAAAPGYAADGRVLVSCSALGLHDSAEGERAARAHLGVLFGRSTAGWEHVATYPVADALPAMPPPLVLARPPRLDDGVFVCGDHRATSSIQGALVSGRHAAEAVLAELHGI